VHRYFTDGLSVHLPAATLDDARMEKIRSVLCRHPGNVPVTLCLQFPTGEKVFVNTSSSFRVSVTQALCQELEGTLGEESVYVAVNRRPCRRPPRPRFSNGGD